MGKTLNKKLIILLRFRLQFGSKWNLGSSTFDKFDSVVEMLCFRSRFAAQANSPTATASVKVKKRYFVIIILCCFTVVCTPGRMIDMLAANSGRVTNLKRVTYTVIDEADRMFDMGFEPQVMRIVDNIRPDRQTVMFSATFPRQMEALARRILNKPIEIQVGGRSVVCKDVEQNVVIIEEEQKFLKLLELLGMYSQHGSVIVFVEKQESADILLRDLIKSSYSCLSLHGGIDQYDRDSTINDFKSGKVKILVATSVAARGLDVKQLILVVNYDCPNHYEDYVHRCGRTGR